VTSTLYSNSLSCAKWGSTNTGWYINKAIMAHNGWGIYGLMGGVFMA